MYSATCRRNRLMVVALLLSVCANAHAYIDLAPTLGKIVRDSQTITVVDVEKFSRDKNAVILKKVRDLKGQTSAEPIRHRPADPGSAIPRPILEWAQPGERGVLFVSSGTALVCVGRTWYQVHSSEDGWWKPGVARPDLPLAYCGAVTRLADALETMLANRTAIITTVPHGASDEGASFDLALNRPNILGQIRIQRIRANLQMPQVVMAVSANPAYLVGQGAVDPSEIPAIIARLGSPEAMVRAESADELRALGALASAARPELARLLQADPNAHVRISSAAALLAIDPKDARPALAALEAELRSPEAARRRLAARAAGLAGAGAASLSDHLARLLDDEDELTRRAALGAIAVLGPNAIGVMDAVVKLLDAPETADDAADALGRMGPAARAVQPHLAKLLDSKSVATRWAGVRAMSQIGGPESRPAVRFMMTVLRDNSEVDGYNMMIYLGLIGPDAKEAIPAIQSAWVKQPALKSAVFWAIEPEEKFPWLAGGGRFGRGGGFDEGDVMRFVYECYVNELGERLAPAARALARKIADHTAGEVPLWAYKVLTKAPADAVQLLTPQLAEKDLLKRENVIVALGYMGPSAAPAKAQVEEALARAANDRERRLIQWCLRSMTGG